MRGDMKWILGDKRGSRIGGPRKGRRFSSAEFRKYDWDIDDAPFVGGRVGRGLEMKLTGGYRNWRGINSKPVERYLSRQVGRLWNDIYSDASAALRRTRIAEAHWSYLLTQYVATQLHVVEDELFWSDWNGGLIPLSHGSARKLYVDPRDGCLHRNTSIETHRMRQKRITARAAQELSSRIRVVSPSRQLHLLGDGSWWEVELQDVKKAKAHGLTEDVVLRASLSRLRPERLYGRRDVMAVGKRQLSAQDMKRHGLPRNVI